ncbi:hypothetical protein ACFFHF_09910 [Robertmurraya beringensis]|uniref:Lipoprotein n=1 Tax=Robertmurraya beringensis TaxID=641660 RepID=A0ABV6KQE9_9BACI
MRKFVSVLMIVLLLLQFGIGCEQRKPEITEIQAKIKVIEKHKIKNGMVKIKSITHKNNEYIIEWENKDNCEYGIDKVDDQNGELKMVEASIC